MDQLTDIDLLFVQDGDDYLSLGKMEDTFGQLLREDTDRFQRVVFVLVPPGSSMDRYHYYHPDGEQHHQYVQMFDEELSPQVRRSIGKNHLIRKTGLLGDSLGGVVSLVIALKRPLRWSHLLLQSAAFEHTFSLTSESLYIDHWHIYQVVGQYEDHYRSQITGRTLHILTENRRLKYILEHTGASVSYYEEPKEHLWDFWREDLHRALTYFTR